MSFRNRAEKSSLLVIISLLAIVVMLAGCTSQTDQTSVNTTVNSTTTSLAYSPALKEKILSQNTYDVDGDNTTDTYVFTYAPVKLKSANVEIQRIVVVGVYKTSLTNIQLKPLPSDRTAIQSLQTTFKNEIDNLAKDTVTSQDSCSSNMGLATFTLCGSGNACGAACVDNGPAFCKKNENSQLSIGFWIFQYVNAITEINKLYSTLSDNTAVLSTFRATQQTNLETLNRILDQIDQVKSNPVMYNSLFGLCTNINYPTKKIYQLMYKLAKFKREPTLYRYAVIIKVKSLGGSNVPVNIVDTLPLKLLNSLQMLDGPQITYNNINGTITENDIPVSPQQTYYATYYFTTPIKPTPQLMQEWRSPQVSSFSTLLQNKTKGAMGIVINGFIGAMDVPYHLLANVFGPHISLGLSIGIYTFIALTLLFIFNLTLTILLAVARNKDPMKELKLSWGVPFTGWIWYIPIAIVCLFIAFILQYLSGAHQYADLTVLNLPKILSNIVGDASIVLIFFATCLTFFGVESAVKTLIAPRPTQRNTGESTKPGDIRKANLVKLSTLKEDVLTLSALIKKNKSIVDITEEEQYLETIPLEKLENLVNSNANPEETAHLLDKYLDKTEEAIKTLKEKVLITTTYWPKWEQYIESTLKTRRVVPLSQLIRIPQKWRLWAVNKYINEKAIGKYVVENNAVKKIVVGDAKEAKEVEQLSKEKSVGGTVLFKNGKLTASFARRGNSTVLAILLQRIDMYVSDILRTIYKTPYYESVIFYSKAKKVIIKKDQNNLLVLWGSRNEIEKKIDEVKKKGKF